MPPEETPGLPGSSTNPTWDQLTDDQKKTEARKMEVYAAMVENLDANIGHIIKYLRDIGAYENTFIFFQSDNGAEGLKGFPDGPNTDNSLVNLGRPLSNIVYGHRWAEVSATPFKLWKGFTAEGGVVVPAIARLPRQTNQAALFAKLTHVTDLAPTFLELAGAADPGSEYQGHAVNPITGFSLLPALRETSPLVHPLGAFLVEELFGRRFIRKDNWKLTWLESPWGNGLSHHRAPPPGAHDAHGARGFSHRAPRLDGAFGGWGIRRLRPLRPAGGRSAAPPRQWDTASS